MLGVAEELALVLVEGGGEAGEGGVAGVEPAGALEAVPGLGLHDYMGAGDVGGEVCGDDSPEAGEDGGDAEGAELVDDAPGGVGALLHEGERDGLDEAAHVAHPLPVLVGGLGDPVADGGVGVAEVEEGLVDGEIVAALDEDGVEAGEGEDVDLVLEASEVPIGVWCSRRCFRSGRSGTDRGRVEVWGGAGSWRLAAPSWLPLVETLRWAVYLRYQLTPKRRVGTVAACTRMLPPVPVIRKPSAFPA